MGIAEHFDGAWMNNYDMSNCRVPGWHIVLTMSLYNATGDPFYLNAAKIIGRRAIQRRTPRAAGGGAWCPAIASICPGIAARRDSWSACSWRE